MALTTTASLQGVPGITELGYTNAVLQQAIDAASAAIKRYTGNKLESATYTQYYSGQDKPDIVLRQRPVSSITSVHYDPTAYGGQGVNPFPAESLLTQGLEYLLVLDGESDAGAPVSKSGLLRRLAGGGSSGPLNWPEPWSNYRGGTLTASRSPCWPATYLGIKVVYVAGYNPVPADVIQAANQLAAWFLKTGAQGGRFLQSESLNSYSYSLGQLQMRSELGSTRQLLSPYKEVALGLGN